MTNRSMNMTIEGYEKLKNELNRLKTEERPVILEALKEAKALGDLSENAEYDAAKNDQALVEGKIKEIEKILENAKIIEKVDTSIVNVGVSVKLKYVDDGEIDTFEIVGSVEADPFENKISDESPIAQAVMNKKVDDVVTVKSPSGNYDVQIIEIF